MRGMVRQVDKPTPVRVTVAVEPTVLAWLRSPEFRTCLGAGLVGTVLGRLIVRAVSLHEGSAS